MRSNKVHYVSTTERFNGHRFCEKDHNMYDQYFGSNVWLWNVSPDGLFPSSVKDQAEANKDWADVYNATGFVFMPNMEAWDWTDMLNMEKGPEAKSPQQGWSPGVVLRPLHPKLEGHRAIKDSLKPYVMRDFAIASLGLPFFSLEANGTNETTGADSTAVMTAGLADTAQSTSLPHIVYATEGSDDPADAHQSAR